MTHKLNIFMVVPGMPFDGNTPKERSLGGSETAAVCMSRELAKLGHDVTVMSNLPPGKDEGEIDGVTYIDIKKAETICQKVPHDVLIVEREPRFFGLLTASKINILWNHDLALKGAIGIMQGALWNIDWVFLLSRFHVEQHLEVYPFLKESHIRQTRNGIDLEDFPQVQKKIKGKVMYAARPERGLVTLVKPGGIMEKLYRADPNIHLHVAGYDNTTDQTRAYYNYLWSRCDELPNVTHLGFLNKSDLYKHLSESEAYLYPVPEPSQAWKGFAEISCIMAMECMAVGTPFITTRHGALPETLGEKTSVMLDILPGHRDYEDRFVGEVLGLLGDKDRRRKMTFQGKERAKKFSWTGVAEQWEELFFERFKEVTSDKEKLVRHFMYHDDWMVARQIAEGETKKEIDEKIGWVLQESTHEKYYRQFSEKELRGKPPEMVGRHYDHVFMREPRWEVIKAWFAENKIQPGAKVLDVGCGPGYFSVGMANEFDVDVTGIDVSIRYVEEAKRLKDQRLKNGNTEFYHTDNDEWQEETAYQVIVISEVLEHIGYMEPQDFVRQFEKYLTDDGWFLVTTPFGPLKRAASRKSDTHHDLHLRHFEKADIEDLFSKKQGYEVEIIYWQHAKPTKELLGWCFYTFQKWGEYGEIDVDRKVAVQVPRDRLSACMIVKDEESVLRRSLDSIIELYDELIVVDTGSSDRTIEISREYGAKIINGSNPLVSGFETPRNESIEKATGDWILWIDADEELQGAENLPKYLRNSVYDGFRIRQHHFSCQPVMMAKIDKPVRAFRNRPGEVKFYGMIHEHPGTNENNGVGNVVELSDVDIAHGGYYAEEERRRKFWRNLPMMKADIAKYPNRILGKWLFMRDLVHLSTWSVEQTGRMTDDARRQCGEVIQLFRNTFLAVGGHMMQEGLEYYSAACRMLGIGIDFSWSVNAGNNGGPDQLRTSRFADKEDFKAFIGKVMDDKAWPYEGEYLR